MLDYLKVKQVFADKLAKDADGIGRFESAFYHTMKFVYEQGVTDGMASEVIGHRSDIGIKDQK